MFLCKIIVLFAICVLTTRAQTQFLKDNYPASVIEDATLDTPGLLKKYRYPEETHYVTTDDGYILGVHRIPKRGGIPVLLLPGLPDSSASWLMMGPSSGFGYYLRDNNFDVWMGNNRGNRYSRNHTTLNPDINQSYWSFTWHEMGLRDLPAMIDYILATTGHRKLHYIAHSQGATIFFVMASLLPEYNSKMRSVSLLSPAAFCKNAPLPLLRLPVQHFELFLENLGEVFPYSPNNLNDCFRSQIKVDACTETMWGLLGDNRNQFSLNSLPLILGHIPTGLNFKQWLHYRQLVASGKFCQYDYGPFENFKRYRSLSPPDYPLSEVTAPVALHYTHKDNFVSPVDVQRLANDLPNVLVNKLYPEPDWVHLSLVMGKQARPLVHSNIIKFMSTLK